VKAKAQEAQKASGLTAINQYIVSIAYSVLASWYKNLKSVERKKYIPFIMMYLRQNSSSGTEEDVEMVLDILAQNSFSDALPEGSLGQPSENSKVKTWLVGNSLVQLESLPQEGPMWFNVVIRRPSGLIEFKASLQPKDPLPKSPPSPPAVPGRNRSNSIGTKTSYTEYSYPGSLGRRRTMVTGSIEGLLGSIGMMSEQEKMVFQSLAQMLPFPDWNFNLFPPISIPEDEFYKRAVKVLDRIPFIDLHKIGIVYVGPEQTHEDEILANTRGSEAYSTFLQSLGEFVPLLNCKDVYTGGLDTSPDLVDGEKALFWADSEKSVQIIFHVTSMMPNRESDPHYTGKKRHIGNDYVLVVWNESGIDPDGANGGFKFDTVAAQFNFINLIITPVFGAESEFCKMYVQLRKDIGGIDIGGGINSGVGIDIEDRPKLLSSSSIPSFMRQFCIHADIFAQVYQSSQNGVQYTSSGKERLRQIKRIRARLIDT